MPEITDQPELKPFAVQIPVARKLLGGKCKTGIYEAIARGELDAVKDGKRTLITTASIERRQKSLPPADFKIYALPPSKKRGRLRKNKNAARA
jgi:hypothetical protein